MFWIQKYPNNIVFMVTLGQNNKFEQYILIIFDFLVIFR